MPCYSMMHYTIHVSQATSIVPASNPEQPAVPVHMAAHSASNPEAAVLQVVYICDPGCCLTLHTKPQE